MNDVAKSATLQNDRRGRAPLVLPAVVLLCLAFGGCAARTPVSVTKETTPVAADERPRATVVMGRVTDVEGEPITGALLAIKKWQSGPKHYSETRSDADGQFSLDALPSNSRLFVYADGYASMYRTHDVTEGVNRGWDFVLPKAAHVSGRVVDTKGNPAPDRVLELWPVAPGPPPAPGVSFYASGGQGQDTTNENGVFDMPSVAPGKHRIIVYRPSPIGGDRSMQQVPLKGRFIEVESGDRVENFEIVTHPPGHFAIAGHVRDGVGNPMAGIGVDTFIPHGRHWWTMTDDNGAFYIEGLDGVGQSSLKVHFNGVTGAGSYKLAIPDVPLNSKSVELVIPENGSIHGTVGNARTGEVVTTYEVTVPVVNLPNSGAVWDEPHVQTERNADGSFSISNTPAGDVTVEVRAEGLGAQRFMTSVEAGETTVLECRMLGPAVFAGRTTMDGEPRPTTIVINGEWLTSDDGGNFSFDKFPNGNLMAWFWVHDGWHRSVAVHLNSGETTRLDVEVGGSCEISGTVTFPDDEEDFCSVRLAAKGAPDGWYEFGRPGVDEFVLAYSHVRESGGEYRLCGIPTGRWYLMAGKYRPSMHRSLLASSKVVELKEGESLRVDFDLTEAEP